MELNDFPNEILIKIFNRLPYEKRPTIRRVCKKWNSLICQDIDVFVACNNFFYFRCDEIGYPDQNVKCFYLKNVKSHKQFLINLFQEIGPKTGKLYFYFDVFSFFREKEAQRKPKNDERSQSVRLISKIFQHFSKLVCLKFNVHNGNISLSSYEFTALLQLVAPNLKQLSIVNLVLADEKCAINLICQHLNPNKLIELTFKTNNSLNIKKMNKCFPWTDLKILWTGDVKSFQDSSSVRFLNFFKPIEEDLEFLLTCPFLSKIRSFRQHSFESRISIENLMFLKKFTGLTKITAKFAFNEIEFVCSNFPKLEYLHITFVRFHVHQNFTPFPPSLHKLKNLHSLYLQDYSDNSEKLQLYKCLPNKCVRFFIYTNMFYVGSLQFNPSLNHLLLNLADIFPNLEVIFLEVPLFHPELLISGVKRLTKIRKVILNIVFTINLFYPLSLAEFCAKRGIEFDYSNSYVGNEHEDSF